MTHLIIAALCFLAGAIVFFFLFNRYILRMTPCFLKLILTYSTACVLSIGGALAGYYLPAVWTLPAAAIVIVIFIIMETRAHRFRNRYRGAPPVSLEPVTDASGNPLATTTRPVIRRFSVPSPSPRLPELRIAHLTDFHADGHLDESYYAACINAVNSMKPDLIFLTGDFAENIEHLDMIARQLKRLESRLGVYGILGNHDYWLDLEHVRTVLRKSGIHLVGGSCVPCILENGSRIDICGTEEPWGVPLPLHTAATCAGDLLIILSHTPDTIFHLDAHLVFAGHLHGGQWRFPITGALVSPSDYGRLLDTHHFVFGRTHLFVSSGIGVSWIPLRLACPPDIIIVDILSHPERISPASPSVSLPPTQPETPDKASSSSAGVA